MSWRRTLLPQQVLHKTKLLQVSQKSAARFSVLSLPLVIFVAAVLEAEENESFEFCEVPLNEINFADAAWIHLRCARPSFNRAISLFSTNTKM